MASDNTTNLGVELTIGGQTVPKTDIANIIVDSELNLPDHCRITLMNTVTKWGDKIKVTDPIVLKLWQGGGQKDTAFAGEVSGVHPNFDATNGSSGEIDVSGLNALHALTRSKKSRTWEGPVTDKQMVTDVLSKYSGLSADFGSKPPTIQTKHVYQHNQNDLEFLRLRATRMGYFILCRDKSVLFQMRTAEVTKPKLMLGANPTPGGATLALEKFKPKVATGTQISQVKVRTWLPDQRDGLICTAKPNDPQGAPKLGESTGNAATDPAHPDTTLTRSDIVFYSKEEGDAIARALLDERRLHYVQAGGSTTGDCRIKPGKVYEVQVNDAKFDGKYFFVRVRYWYRGRGGERFTTEFHACRDATSSSSGPT